MQPKPSIESMAAPGAGIRGGAFAKLRSALRGDRHMVDAYEPVWGPPATTTGDGQAGDGLADLRDRVRRLESLVEGLQDATYREATRQDERIHALRARTEPAEMARALSAEARKRGV